MSKKTTDHQEIRSWAEKKGGRPAAVEETSRQDDPGIIRIMFPDAPNSEHDELKEISWDAFFETFEDRELALVYDEDSMFSKLIDREGDEARS